ncbi:uncharacterized protein LOC132309647 [Cornus florida]|uniref:uncharacterized protein LOC132309647 n=1 Tax=Cornus florida TaxID=4283 RepID=UPI00289751AA|nr:uncharacterized protein LOC132309647 [Cornus florida]
MDAYREEVEKLTKCFDTIKFQQIPREENSIADRLANATSIADKSLTRVIPIDVLDTPSVTRGITTPRRPTGETPFSLAYGTEAVIPTEVVTPTIRSLAWNQKSNNQLLEHSLDLLEEKREAAAIRLAAYQPKIANSYNKRVRRKSFNPGDLILLKSEKYVSKLEPNWEGPYRISDVIGKRAYRLRHLDGTEMAKPKNAMNLKRYFQ